MDDQQYAARLEQLADQLSMDAANMAVLGSEYPVDAEEAHEHWEIIKASFNALQEFLSP